MRFSVAHAEVEAEGFAETAAFQIAASGKAFKGLIDGLYSRKIEAAVRELATNALDAHIAAGNPEPFYVHLPKAFEPTFYIRDYGTGMPHELVMRRYSTMFDSTKDGANSADNDINPDEQVGMLGLGSKSFFAYTDSCTLTIFMDGEARFYSVYMGADGVPQIAFAGKQPSDELTGVKVEFPVKTKDCTEFENAAVRVFKGFPYMPDGFGETIREKIECEPMQVGTFWKAYHKDYLPKGGYWARQGCVLYPIDLASIDERATEQEKTYWDHHALEYRTKVIHTLSGDFADYATLEATVVIDFPIGSLDFDLGRERLAYNDRTIIALRKRWDEMIEDVSKEVAAKFADAASDWEYLTIGAGISFDEMGKLYKMTTPYRKLEEVRESFKLLFAQEYYQRGTKLVQTVIVPDSLESLSYFSSRTPVETKQIGDSVFVIIDHQVNRINQRITNYLKTKGLKQAFVIRRSKKEAKEALKLWGKVPTILASKLPEPPKIVREKKPKLAPAERTFQRIKLLDKNHNFYSPTEPEEYEGHVFAFMNCGNIHNPDPLRYPHLPMYKVLAYHRMLKAFLGKSISFINVKSNEYNKLDQFSEFPLFYDLIDEIGKPFSRRHLMMLINKWNHNQFHYSVYDKVIDDWDEAVDGELAKLKRFERRFESIPSEFTTAINQVLEFPELRERVISQAIEAGLEVLPERHNYTIPYPLLPPKWERFTQMLRVTKPGYDHKKSIYKQLKRSFEC